MAEGAWGLAKGGLHDPAGTAKKVADRTMDAITQGPHALGEALSNGFDAFVDASPERQGEMFGEVGLTNVVLFGVGETAEAQQLFEAVRGIANRGLSRARLRV